MFDWDKDNIAHIAANGVVPIEAEQVIGNNPIDLHPQQHESEERILQVGVTDALRVLVVVSTWRDDHIRVVTAYPAPPHLREFYFAEKAGFYDP